MVFAVGGPLLRLGTYLVNTWRGLLPAAAQFDCSCPMISASSKNQLQTWSLRANASQQYLTAFGICYSVKKGVIWVPYTLTQRADPCLPFQSLLSNSHHKAASNPAGHCVEDAHKRHKSASQWEVQTFAGTIDVCSIKRGKASFCVGLEPVKDMVKDCPSMSTPKLPCALSMQVHCLRQLHL